MARAAACTQITLALDVYNPLLSLGSVSPHDSALVYPSSEAFVSSGSAKPMVSGVLCARWSRTSVMPAGDLRFGSAVSGMTSLQAVSTYSHLLRNRGGY